MKQFVELPSVVAIKVIVLQNMTNKAYFVLLMFNATVHINSIIYFSHGPTI